MLVELFYTINYLVPMHSTVTMEWLASFIFTCYVADYIITIIVKFFNSYDKIHWSTFLQVHKQHSLSVQFSVEHLCCCPLSHKLVHLEWHH